MFNLFPPLTNNPLFPAILAMLVLWDAIWKGFGLWAAIKNNQRYWFVAILVLNTFGVLPIIYLKYFQKKLK